MPTRIDPTRTTLLRRSFETDIRRRFLLLKHDVAGLVVRDDVFGLGKGEPFSYIANEEKQAWRFLTNDRKMEQFRKWLGKQVEQRLLTTDAKGDPWTGKYVESAYKKGVLRAYVDARGKKLQRSSDFIEGSKEQFLKSVFGQPEMLSKVKLLATRAFEDLRGVSATMATKMNRILANGLVQGRNPKQIAREMVKQIDGLSKGRALTIARTEVVHAHAEGQLDSFEELGVEEVGILAEWLTAGDDRVCPLCEEMEGQLLTISEARGLLPRHPNCVLPGNIIEGRVIAALEGWYSGDAVEITTVNGTRFSLTVNHPVLTEDGFVPAGELQKDSNLLCHLSQRGSSVGADIENAPTPIEKVYESFPSVVLEEAVSGLHLYGDAQSMVGEVKVVTSNLFLAELHSSKQESKLDVFFIPACDGRVCSFDLMSALCPRHSAPFDGLGFTLRSQGHASISDAPAYGPARNPHVLGDAVAALPLGVALDNLSTVQLQAMPGECRFGGASQLDIVFEEPPFKGAATDRKLVGELLQRFPSGVALDQVVDIRRFTHDGPVYDVESPVGYFTTGFGNGGTVIIKNCRCAWAPAVDAETKGRRKKLLAAIGRSTKAETGEKTVKKAKAQSTWAGSET